MIVDLPSPSILVWSTAMKMSESCDEVPTVIPTAPSDFTERQWNNFITSVMLIETESVLENSPFNGDSQRFLNALYQANVPEEAFLMNLASSPKLALHWCTTTGLGLRKVLWVSEWHTRNLSQTAVAALSVLRNKYTNPIEVWELSDGRDETIGIAAVDAAMRCNDASSAFEQAWKFLQYLGGDSKAWRTFGRVAESQFLFRRVSPSIIEDLLPLLALHLNRQSIGQDRSIFAAEFLLGKYGIPPTDIQAIAKDLLQMDGSKWGDGRDILQHYCRSVTFLDRQRLRKAAMQHGLQRAAAIFD
ncbi:hypothetical protein HDU93_004469 [Gonapodya sp. JEL0774]|nr:hypothetical protein HDU93_004469 [Gonapodya sp. JEL0774]